MSTQRARRAEHSRPKSPKRSASLSQQQSLNHLLNFSLPPRVHHVQATPRRSKKTGHHAWNPERFINAQYRFVMRPTGDYTVHFADPDIYFQWPDILQVIISRPASGIDNSQELSGVSTCPICLSPPIAPRMTKCGHVFCYPCILHYIETGNTPKWHRCPICFDSITAAQLKSVRWADSPKAPLSDQDIPMRLMQRPHITTLSLPRSDTWQATYQSGSDLLQPHEAPFHFLPDVEQYARFMLASPEQLILDITREIDDLDAEERSLSAMGDDLGVMFVVRAREKCINTLLKAQEMEQDASLRLQMERKRNLLRDAISQAEARRRREASLGPPSSALPTPPPDFGLTEPIEHSNHQSIAITAPTPLAVAGSRNSRNKRSLNPPPHSSSSYYYYQAASGANVFLHPLDIRILLAHFGNYPSFPNNITAHVAHASESTVDDDLRRRCKYLAHLPEGADVVFLELDLENVVGQETLRQFDNLLKVRRTRHKERAKKDDKARLRAEEKERDNVLSSLAAPVDNVDRLQQWQWESPSFSHVDAPEGYSMGIEDLTIGIDHISPHSTAPPAELAQRTPTAASGVWGARSFASAAQSAPSLRSASGPPTGRRREEDDLEIDEAWQELEDAQLKAGGGRNKRGRGKKLVLLGSGAGGRRL